MSNTKYTGTHILRLTRAERDELARAVMARIEAATQADDPRDVNLWILRSLLEQLSD